MSKVKIRPFNVIDHTDLPEIKLDRIPVDGDPLEIDREMYYVCETNFLENDDKKIGVIPLVVKNPSKVANIESYINCLSIAHRRVQFRKEKNICDFNDCDEMVIS
ncbi:MAG: hypothetical protein Q8868_01925 [Bacteroidota bacterium]|nr:hypothetical protein [Bacteroidota bacterium]